MGSKLSTNKEAIFYQNNSILAPFWEVPGAQDGNKNRFQNVFSAPSRSFESQEGPKGPLGPPKMRQDCHFRFFPGSKMALKGSKMALKMGSKLSTNKEAIFLPKLL